MGRKVRRVPPGWRHPIDNMKLKFIPLYDGAEYGEEFHSWMDSLDSHGNGITYQQWITQPDPRDYMPTWPPWIATHYMMYETVSKGTPISPAFATPEELAMWLVDNE